jgi:hypothetical protein
MECLLLLVITRSSWSDQFKVVTMPEEKLGKKLKT